MPIYGTSAEEFKSLWDAAKIDSAAPTLSEQIALNAFAGRFTSGSSGAQIIHEGNTRQARLDAVNNLLEESKSFGAIDQEKYDARKAQLAGLTDSIGDTSVVRSAAIALSWDVKRGLGNANQSLQSIIEKWASELHLAMHGLGRVDEVTQV